MRRFKQVKRKEIVFALDKWITRQRGYHRGYSGAMLVREQLALTQQLQISN